MKSTDDPSEPAALALLAAKYAKIAGMIQEFSLGWNEREVLSRLAEIHRFVLFNTEGGIPLARRRKIARLARDLSAELKGLGGLDDHFPSTLSALSQNAPPRTIEDRKTGQRNVKSSVRRMAVRLYIEASDQPGFTINGPLFKFVNAVGSLTLDGKGTFTNDSVRCEFNTMKLAVGKGDSEGRLSDRPSTETAVK